VEPPIRLPAQLGDDSTSTAPGRASSTLAPTNPNGPHPALEV